MIGLEEIGYVRLGVSDLDDAVTFATRILGLELVERGVRRALFRSDDRHHTLAYEEGDPGVQTVGFELQSAQDLDAVAAQLERSAAFVRAGTATECDQRHVEDFIAFTDPSGNSIELTTRQHRSGRRFFGSRDAGVTGFSHIGLRTTDAPRDEKFWTGVCNARVSDWIGTAPLLRISPVHHSLALFPSTYAGIQHVNHQVESIDDLMRSFYLLQERGVRVVFGPGRHATSGAVFLYFEGPDGMTYEYSTGVMRIDDEAAYRPRQFPFAPESFCVWGSRPDIPEFRRSDETLSLRPDALSFG